MGLIFIFYSKWGESMFGIMKEISELQKKYRKLESDKILTKKNICDLLIPFRDKYRLKDLEALEIARDELSTSKVISTIENSLDVKCEIRRWFVERPKGNCIVTIMQNKSDGTYSFVNLTAGHICTCRFDSVEKALEDMEEQKKVGKVTDWYEL